MYSALLMTQSISSYYSGGMSLNGGFIGKGTQHSIVLSDTVDADKYTIQIAYDDIHLIGWF
jgi:hypothetical protein